MIYVFYLKNVYIFVTDNKNKHTMYYSEHTTKETICEYVKNAFTVIKDESFDVYILNSEESNTVLFQIEFFNKRIELNTLLILGLAGYDTAIQSVKRNNREKASTLVTWHVNKIK